MDLSKPGSPDPSGAAQPGYVPPQQPYATPPGYSVPPGYPPPYPPSGYPPYAAAPPPSAVAWVVVGFIFFWPIGIASLLAQLKIGPAWYAGDRPGAELYARQARTRGKLAMVIGIALFVVYLVFFIAVWHRIEHTCNGFFGDC